jgi:glycosyltransferase involved in cell wall biosynthesis
MRIAFVTDGITPYVIGGMQKHSFNLLKYLARAGVHVDLYHYNQSKLNIDALEVFTDEEKKFIHPEVLHFPAGNKLPGHYIKSSYGYSCLAFDRYLKKPAVDLIYCKGFAGWKFVQERIKHKALPPVLVNFHGYEMFQPAPDFKTKIQQVLFLKSPVSYILKHADGIFSYGGKITQLLREQNVPEQKLIEIPGGIDPAWVLDLASPVETKKKFVFVGRFERRKGIQELTKALDSMKDQPFAFTFIGPVPSDQQIKHPNIEYLGEIRDGEKIKSILSTMDVLVCPSYSEGMPNVIMEGMARGCAIIATDVGAVSLLVKSDNGQLVEIGSVASIEKALEAFIAMEKDALQQMKAASIRRIALEFTWDKIAQQHIEQFKRFMA